MAKERMLNTRIWNDNWVSKLDPIEKLLFVYFLTNEHTNISGIYELPLKIAAVETGIDPSMFEKIMPRLAPKVLYQGGWIILTNFPKYQNLKSHDVILGIKREFALAPKFVQEEAIMGGWGEGLETVPTSPRILNLTKLNLQGEVETSHEEFISEAVDDNGNPLTPRKKQDTSYRKIFNLFGVYPKNWNLNRTEIASAKNILEEHSLERAIHALEIYKKYKHLPDCPQILKPSDLDRKWVNLEALINRI